MVEIEIGEIRHMDVAEADLRPMIPLMTVRNVIGVQTATNTNKQMCAGVYSAIGIFVQMGTTPCPDFRVEKRQIRKIDKRFNRNGVARRGARGPPAVGASSTSGFWGGAPNSLRT